MKCKLSSFFSDTKEQNVHHLERFSECAVGHARAAPMDREAASPKIACE